MSDDETVPSPEAFPVCEPKADGPNRLLETAKPAVEAKSVPARSANTDKIDSSKKEPQRTPATATKKRRSVADNSPVSEVPATPKRAKQDNLESSIIQKSADAKHSIATPTQSPKLKAQPKSRASLPAQRVRNGKKGNLTSGQGSITKYMKPSCVECSKDLKTISESNFHVFYHKRSKCMVCSQHVADAKALDSHFQRCLLLKGKLQTAELLSYMPRCSIRLRKTDFSRYERPEMFVEPPKKPTDKSRDSRKQTPVKSVKDEAPLKCAESGECEGDSGTECELLFLCMFCSSTLTRSFLICSRGHNGLRVQ